jgi:hypothetical protein
MATNKSFERLSQLTLLAPTGVNIASGAACLFGRKEITGDPYPAACVAQEAQNTTNPPYDPNTGYLSFDFEGGYNLTVLAETLGSPSAGAAINTGDAIYYSGGTYDPTSGITYGGTLCRDTNGTFFGRAMAPVLAGTSAIISVMLRNSA